MRLLVLGRVVLSLVGQARSRASIENTSSRRSFDYIEPFAAKQMIRSREITPLFV